jgi:hypothetical protein
MGASFKLIGLTSWLLALTALSLGGCSSDSPKPKDPAPTFQNGATAVDLMDDALGGKPSPVLDELQTYLRDQGFSAGDEAAIASIDWATATPDTLLADPSYVRGLLLAIEFLRGQATASTAAYQPAPGLRLQGGQAGSACAAPSCTFCAARLQAGISSVNRSFDRVLTSARAQKIQLLKCAVVGAALAGTGVAAPAAVIVGAFCGLGALLMHASALSEGIDDLGCALDAVKDQVNTNALAGPRADGMSALVTECQLCPEAGPDKSDLCALRHGIYYHEKPGVRVFDARNGNFVLDAKDGGWVPARDGLRYGISPENMPTGQAAHVIETAFDGTTRNVATIVPPTSPSDVDLASNTIVATGTTTLYVARVFSPNDGISAGDTMALWRVSVSDGLATEVARRTFQQPISESFPGAGRVFLGLTVTPDDSAYLGFFDRTDQGMDPGAVQVWKVDAGGAISRVFSKQLTRPVNNPYVNVRALSSDRDGRLFIQLWTQEGGPAPAQRMEDSIYELSGGTLKSVASTAATEIAYHIFDGVDGRGQPWGRTKKQPGVTHFFWVEAGKERDIRSFPDTTSVVYTGLLHAWK